MAWHLGHFKTAVLPRLRDVVATVHYLRQDSRRQHWLMCEEPEKIAILLGRMEWLRHTSNRFKAA
jgi:hypothetical protein